MKLIAKIVAVIIPLAAIAFLARFVTSPAVSAPPAASAAPGRSHQQHALAALKAGSGILIGVREDGIPGPWQPVSAFTAATGIRPRLILLYSTWRQPFPWWEARQARQHGAALIIQLQPWGNALSQIADGGYDGYLRSYARAVRSFGHPVVIGFGHEMNGRWYPWGYGHQPARSFVAAWRHVVTVFRRQGASNVTWLWTVSRVSPHRYRSYWPGSGYVTWVGLDGYFATPQDTFAGLFAAAIRDIRRLTGKPILLSETAAGPLTGRQAADITALFAGVRRHHLLGLVYFDVNQHSVGMRQDWRLEDSPSALRAFRRAARALVPAARSWPAG